MSKQPAKRREKVEARENGYNLRSNISLGNLTPEQAISGLFKMKPADVQRIREEEQKMRAKQKKGRK